MCFFATKIIKLDTKQKYRILGIDPGTNALGYAIIEVNGQAIQMVEIGVLTLTHLDEHQDKLKRIFERIQEIIDVHKPREAAIEAPFFGKNVQSMLKLGRAQGVAIAAIVTKGLRATEYAPREIKQSVTGKGAASKEQVAAMLEHILKIKLDAYTLDATDALGAAVCHQFRSNSVLGGGKKFSGWGAYVKENAKKVK
jgi:crossover junction endodeoxyribonuclease RuvC